jgi:hypothetical protein
MGNRPRLAATTLVLSFFATARAQAANYEVGPAQAIKSPCSLFAQKTLGPGDVVLVDSGTYTDACQVTASGSSQQPITLQGAPGPRPVFDATGLDLSGAGSVPRAVFQFTGGSHWVAEHLELKNASGSSGNGAAFRVTADSDDITIQDVSIHDCQDGVMGDGAGAATIKESEIFHNGANDGQTHNFYMQNDTVHLIGNYIHDSNGGQNVKMRARYVELFYNYIANAGNYEIDLIQGPLTGNANANVAMVGNIVVRNPNAANDGQTIVWGSDNPAQAGRNGSLYAINNTFVMTAGTNRLFNAISPPSSSRINLINNIIHASTTGTAVGSGAGTDAIIVGTNNWVTTGIAAPASLMGSVTGSDPGFVSATDYELTTGAAVIGKGLSFPTFVDGAGTTQDGTPKFETIVASGQFSTVGRPANATLDLGAYEFGTPGDAGLPDGGVVGGDDAASGGDASPGDAFIADSSNGAGPPGDGAQGQGAAPATSSGCGCTVGAATWGGGSLASWWVLAIAMLRRRRR